MMLLKLLMVKELMLGINKRQFNVLRNHQTRKAYKAIQLFPNAYEDFLEKVVASGIHSEDLKEIIEAGFNVNKTISYLSKTGCNAHEWLHYTKIMKQLNYNLDDSYLYPKDFRKEDSRITREYEEKTNAEKDAPKNILIANISKALRENEFIKEFFAGSNGLQILVPETAQDLRQEGRILHNCLSTYIDRVATGKTLIFFIRRIDNPTSPYIAMEYCHGRVVQCRLDHNVAVKDEKIINFAEALAKKLREQNILAA